MRWFGSLKGASDAYYVIISLLVQVPHSRRLIPVPPSLAHTVSYGMWTYLTVPFSLTWAGFQAAEIEPWHEQRETWRRLKVKFPPRIASHSTEQTFYFDNDGLLRRHDYDVEISGHFPAAHYVSDYMDVSGIMLPTMRRVFTRQPDNTPVLDEVLISIDLSDIRFE